MVTPPTSLSDRRSSDLPDPVASGHDSPGPAATQAVARSAPPFPHLRPLDGLRGIAVALVVAYHLAPGTFPGGFLGVDVFFVLSGFLITSLLVGEAGTDGGIALGRFYLRRLRRLAPALLLVLAAIALYAAVWATPGELGRLRVQSLWTLGYLANWRFIVDGTTYTDLVAGASPLRHAWSLAIEEQFYVVFPFVVLAVGALVRWRNDALRRGLVLVAGVGALASVIAMAVLYDPTNPSRAYFGTDTRAHGLLVGVALGAMVVGRPPRQGLGARIAVIAGALGSVVLVLAVALAHETSPWLYHGGFLLVSLGVAGIIAALGRAQWLVVPLSWKPLVGLGLISYGVYLWHWPIIVIFDEQRTGLDGVALAAFRIGLTLAVSLLSSKFVEQPIRHGALRRHLGRAALLLVPVGVAALALVLVWSTSGTVPSTDAAFTGPSAPTVAEPHRVLIAGDSVAHTIAGGAVGDFPHFTPWAPAQSPFDPARVQLWSVARPACSFLPGKVGSKSAGAGAAADLGQFCGDWRADTDQALTDHASQVLVVALANDDADRYQGKHLVEFGSDEYQTMLTSFLDELHGLADRHGATLALVALPPHTGRFAGPDDKGGWRELQLGQLERDYASAHPGVQWLDLSSQICPGGDCDHPAAGFQPSWRYDGEHYDGNGARWVAAWLSDQLDQLDPTPQIEVTTTTTP